MANNSIPDMIERTAKEFNGRPGSSGRKEFSVQLKDLRNRVGLSQEAFAATYNIPLRNVENWEQGTRPDAAARLLIQMIATDPQRVAEIVARAKAADRRPKRTLARA